MNSGDEKLKGVRGWLLLFCFSLTVLDPVAVIVNLFTAADAAKPYFAQDPGLMRLVLANGVAGIALSVFSLYAGISLWRRLPGAPAVARKYLLTVLAYSVLAPFLPTSWVRPNWAARGSHSPSFPLTRSSPSYTSAPGISTSTGRAG